IKAKTFQFFFADERDALRILNGSPWLVQNSWLLLKKWEKAQCIDYLDFTMVPVKVQLWGLPVHCKTSRMGHKIGACLGQVKSVDLFETRESVALFSKFWLNWIVCYSCDLIGHDEEYCAEKKSHTSDREDKDKNLGPWLRASKFGRRIEFTPKDMNKGANTVTAR
ncbi:hypothetical protein SESBI_11528, partial [Sesbania bispinosa]